MAGCFLNFLKEKDFINESSLSRVYTNLNNPEMCMIAISADRNEYKDPKIIKERQKDLEHDIKLGKFGFTKVKGGYTENKGTDKENDVEEVSFLVTFKKDRFDEAINYFIKLAKKYEQEEILVVKDAESQYMNQKGKVTFKLGAWKPRQVDAYFTKLKNGKKFSFDVAESIEGDLRLLPSEQRHSDYVLKSLKNGTFELESEKEYKQNIFNRWSFNH